MPESGQIIEDDEDEDYSQMVNIEPAKSNGSNGHSETALASPEGSKRVKRTGFFKKAVTSSFELARRAFSFGKSQISKLTTSEFYIDSDQLDNCDDPELMIESMQRESDFLDTHLDFDTLTNWFDKRKQAFISQVFPQFFVKHLSESELFDSDEYEKLKQELDKFGDLHDPYHRERVYTAQNAYLYSTLQTHIKKRPSLIRDLISVLRAEDWNPGLADSFEAELNYWRNQMKIQLSTCPQPVPSVPFVTNQTLLPPKPTTLLFNIPEPISYYVQRTRKSEELLSALRDLAMKGSGWLILHGMGGSGKTVLAASTVRKQYELNPDLFSDGIFWLTIGNLSAKSDPVGSSGEALTPTSSTSRRSVTIADLTNQLILKMELLAELVRPFDKDQQFTASTKFDQLDIAIHKLKTHFQANRKSLLVLDNVWSMEVVEKFQFNIPVLLTTRDNTICPREFFNLVPISIVSHGIHSGDVLLMEESLALLLKCLKLNLPQPDLVKMDQLMENFHIVEILKHYKGLPYCIPQIANCMEHFYRLAEESKQALASQLSDDDLPIPCHTEWAQLYTDIVQTGSQAFDTHKLVRQSIQSLDPNIKDLLYDFVIFYDSVPFAVFQTLWHKLGRDREILAVLMKLVEKSLVIKNVQTIANAYQSPAQAASFTLHNITLTFLRDQMEPSKIKERHAKLVNSYFFLHCRVVQPENLLISFDYSKLPNDNYIYHNLAYHLYAADMRHLFAPIFLNLRFAANKIAQVGPSDLLNDYLDFQQFFGGDEKKLRDYNQFIAANSSVLCEPNVDILQLALCEPEESSVYQEAKCLVQGSGRVYLNWTNKHHYSMEAPPKIISFKCAPEVNCASYSLESRYIATVSGRTLQLWNGFTGELLWSLDQQHHDQINHCCFSRNGQFLLTCGDDKQAIMWQNMLSFKNRSVSFVDMPDCGTSNQLNPINNNHYEEKHKERRRRSSGNSGHSVESSTTLLPSSSMAGGGSPRAPRSPFGTSQQVLIRHQTFYLQMSKLKSDPISGSWETGGSEQMKCGDISPDNKLVLTGNGTGNLHLWSVADAIQIVTPLALTHEENGVLDESAKIVECAAFSPNGSFILGLFGSVVHVYSISNQEPSTNPNWTPPSSPKSGRRSRVTVSLVKKLDHRYKVYNAVFHQKQEYYPTVFTSSDKYIFEWNIYSNKSRIDSLFSNSNKTDNTSPEKPTAKFRKYSLTSAHQDNATSTSGHLSFGAVSKSGNRIAGFEHTRNEICLWNRGELASGYGFGSGSSSPNQQICSPYSSLRCHSNIVTLAFSSDEETLLGCGRSGEITVWEIGKHVKKSSIVDLKKQFSVSFGDEEQNVNILTIDTKGFLRLFAGLAGDESESFAMDLRERLEQHNAKKNGIESEELMTLNRLDIICCDIAPNGEIIFGTSDGELYFYDPNAKPDSILVAERHGNSIEPVLGCEFITKESLPTKFCSISESLLTIYTKQPECSKFDQRPILLGQIDSFKLIPALSWIVYWSDGDFFVKNYDTSDRIFDDYLGSKIISVDYSAEDTHSRRLMCISTADRQIRIYGIHKDSNEGSTRFNMGLRLDHPQIPRSCRISNDMKFLIIGDDAGGLCRLSLTDELLTWTRPDAHTTWVYDLVISADTRYILSASKSVKLWNAADGTLLQTFITHGLVTKLTTRFVETRQPNQLTREFQNQSNEEKYKPTVTIVTLTDSTFYGHLTN